MISWSPTHGPGCFKLAWSSSLANWLRSVEPGASSYAVRSHGPATGEIVADVPRIDHSGHAKGGKARFGSADR